MKKVTTWFASACLVAFTLTSCHTEHRVADNTTSKNGRNPKFIDGIVLSNKKSNNIRMRVVDHNKEMAAIQPASANVLQSKYASMLGVIPRAITNLSLYEFIDEWYGVNYRYGGNDKTGIDCSAFVQRLYESVFGVNLVRTAMDQFSNCKMVWDNSQLKEGDLVFFHIHSHSITHVGIYLMNNYFVHASVSQGVMISNLNDAYWQKYFAGAGKILNNNG